MLTQPESEDTPVPSPPEQVADQAGAGAPETCLSCGYVLTGIPIDAPCPECGLSAASRNARFLMERASSGALRRLRIGAQVTYGGLIASTIGLVSSVVIAFVEADRPAPVSQRAGFAMLIPICAGLLAVFVGSLILTWADPLKRRPVDPPPQRIAAFWAGVALPITLAGAFLTAPWFDPGVWIVLMGVEFLTWSIASLRWITRLLSELPDRLAARRADSLVTGWFFSAIGFFAMWAVIDAVSSVHYGPSGTTVVTLIILALFPAILMILVMIRALRSIRAQCGAILAARA